MSWTVKAKRLVGLDPTPTGIGSHQRTVHECTVCGTEFDVEGSTCPNCGSHLLREKTTTPRAGFNLAFAVVTAGLAVAYNVLTGNYPKEGPGA
ncbi:hypothetical protein [Halococcus sp. IIIV-5B]|uniref:hypothetical protein n=1 Tax=Halococcus sp. IIIV-5B TaxID=2321230 RepID=UPI000E707C72|nr:hypothetical protein [Halococcus sp. IIIV-5B]RJT03317.1 hypothetical protein D3261_11485 [Halococcus sp. IIIV-5B]